jgi:hypothetical protein
VLSTVVSGDVGTGDPYVLAAGFHQPYCGTTADRGHCEYSGRDSLFRCDDAPAPSLRGGILIDVRC